MIKKLLAVSLLLAVAVMATAAPTRTQNSGLQKVTWAWTSAADGSWSESTELHGIIQRVTTDPGSAAPTDNWDMVLNDELGIDLFSGRGANRDTANSEAFCPGQPITDGTTTSTIPVAVHGPVTLAVTNAGNAKTGTVYIYLKVDRP